MTKEKLCLASTTAHTNFKVYLILFVVVFIFLQVISCFTLKFSFLDVPYFGLNSCICSFPSFVIVITFTCLIASTCVLFPPVSYHHSSLCTFINLAFPLTLPHFLPASCTYFLDFFLAVGLSIFLDSCINYFFLFLFFSPPRAMHLSPKSKLP